MSTPVLLFHGLGRSRQSMAPLARALRRDGYAVRNVGYASTCHGIDRLVETVVAPEVDRALAESERVHFVTHSLGGVLVRAYAAQRFDAGDPLPSGSRAVMLAPPHGGSPVAEVLRDRQPFRGWCGPALRELGTGDDSVPRGLGPVRGVEAGVIAGTRNLLPFGRLFEEAHDGLVTVGAATGVDGLADAVVVRKSHTLLMMSPLVIGLVRQFLERGRFTSPNATEDSVIGPETRRGLGG